MAVALFSGLPHLFAFSIIHVHGSGRATVDISKVEHRRFGRLLLSLTKQSYSVVAVYSPSQTVQSALGLVGAGL